MKLFNLLLSVLGLVVLVMAQTSTDGGRPGTKPDKPRPPPVGASSTSTLPRPPRADGDDVTTTIFSTQTRNPGGCSAPLTATTGIDTTRSCIEEQHCTVLIETKIYCTGTNLPPPRTTNDDGGRSHRWVANHARATGISLGHGHSVTSELAAQATTSNNMGGRSQRWVASHAKPTASSCLPGMARPWCTGSASTTYPMPTPKGLDTDARTTLSTAAKI